MCLHFGGEGDTNPPPEDWLAHPLWAIKMLKVAVDGCFAPKTRDWMPLKHGKGGEKKGGGGNSSGRVQAPYALVEKTSGAWHFARGGSKMHDTFSPPRKLNLRKPELSAAPFDQPWWAKMVETGQRWVRRGSPVAPGV